MSQISESNTLPMQVSLVTEIKVHPVINLYKSFSLRYFNMCIIALYSTYYSLL